MIANEHGRTYENGCTHRVENIPVRAVRASALPYCRTFFVFPFASAVFIFARTYFVCTRFSRTTPALPCFSPFASVFTLGGSQEVYPPALPHIFPFPFFLLPRSLYIYIHILGGSQEPPGHESGGDERDARRREVSEVLRQRSPPQGSRENFPCGDFLHPDPRAGLRGGGRQDGGADSQGALLVLLCEVVVYGFFSL